MPTLKETILERKRRLAAKDGGVKSAFMEVAPNMVREAVDGLRPQLLEALIPIVEEVVLKHAEEFKIKGDQGDPGEDAEAVNEDALLERLKQHLPTIDEEKIIATLSAKLPKTHVIVRKVLEQIPMPEPIVLEGAPALPAEIDHEKLATLVADKLVSDKKLSVEHIGGLGKAMDAFWKRVRGQSKSGIMRGGGDIVLAGSGISLSRDSVGRTTITNTTGFTTLAATETPNGNTTVFTFAGAAAQPAYIVADGAWTKATGASGQVNWTWSAGAKQATLNVAPSSDIYAVV